MDNAANNKRIAKNTALLYIRMLIMMLVSLYTSRVTLQVLGVTDFGIYNVVAGVVFMIGFFQSSLSNAAQRYLSLSIGKNDVQGAEIAFRQSFSILLVFSFLDFGGRQCRYYSNIVSGRDITAHLYRSPYMLSSCHF